MTKTHFLTAAISALAILPTTANAKKATYAYEIPNTKMIVMIQCKSNSADKLKQNGATARKVYGQKHAAKIVKLNKDRQKFAKSNPSQDQIRQFNYDAAEIIGAKDQDLKALGCKDKGIVRRK